MRGLSAALLVILLPCRAQAHPKAPDPRARPPEVVVAAVGDLLLGRYLPGGAPGERIYSTVGRAADPFAEVAPLLRRADIAFGNLETPLMREPARLVINGPYTFRGEPDRARLLAQAGFDALSLANNHTANLGAGGAAETRRHLEAQGVRGVGAGQSPAEAQRASMFYVGAARVAVLAVSLWNADHPPVAPDGAVAYVRPDEFLRVVPQLVQELRARQRADFVVVSLHWGLEYAPHPSEDQRERAHALVDAGADLVLGHHAHVLQDLERYRGAVIAYSLGNFLFDNPALPTRQTVILTARLLGGGALRQVKEVTLQPVLIGRGDFQPHLATGADHRAIAQRLAELAPGFAVAPDPAAPVSGAPRPRPGPVAAALRPPGWVDPSW